jgi:hypothetical protein
MVVLHSVVTEAMIQRSSGNEGMQFKEKTQKSGNAGRSLRGNPKEHGFVNSLDLSKR